MNVSHWADALQLRPELIGNQGQITDLQMSLFGAVYKTMDVPYQEPVYYSDITEPTAGLVRFLGRLAARLGSDRSLKALYHLDQGMGGGKSHALVGAYHLANAPTEFFETELGRQVLAEAEQTSNGPVDLTGARAVVLSADNMTPGKASPEFGPATTLHERFLWSLFDGDVAKYRLYRDMGSDKAALRRALEAAAGAVLVLLDELMDYAMQLSDAEHLAGMPGEKAFLNALMDAVDDVPNVAFVVVMIRSDAEQNGGYPKEAEDFRSYVAARLERNGTTVAVTEAQDFAAIIQRRIFQRAAERAPVTELAKEYEKAATGPWREQVFDKLGAGRVLAGFADRLTRTYPFHPDLMMLVRDDWSRHAGFQRVRSTVEIFAATAHHWVREHQSGRWAPPLIGVGDVPVTVVLEQVLSSGLLHGNDAAIQNYRQVAATDIASKDGKQGRAVDLDRVLTERGLAVAQPAPIVRMATALFHYSLVARSQARRGATRPELMAAVFVPTTGCSFGALDEAFNLLMDTDEGLGALEITLGNGGNTPARYQLSTTHTLRMFLKQARGSVDANERDKYIWERAQKLASRGLFEDVIPVSQPEGETTALNVVFENVDQNGKNRLVVLDLRRWTLLDGRDFATRRDIESLLGVGATPLSVDNGASCVVVCANTQRRETVRKRAGEVMAWKSVVALLDPGVEQKKEAERSLMEAERKLDGEVLRAYQHFAYLVRSESTEIEWKRFDDDAKSALKGEHVWDALEKATRAVRPHALTSQYLRTLLSKIARSLSLKEIVQQFTKNAAFPLVSSQQDIRDSIYGLLSGPDAYEVVNPDGDPLTITSSADLVLGSNDTLLRPAVRAEATPGSGTGVHTGEPDGRAGAVAGAGGMAAGEGKPKARAQAEYKRYTLRLPNKSLVNRDNRNLVYLLLGELSDKVDPAGPDIQLIDLTIEVTAAEGVLDNLEARAKAAGARWSEAQDLLL